MKGLLKMLKQQYTSIVYKWYQLLRAKGYGRCTSFASACSNAMHTFHPESFDGTLPTIWNGSDANRYASEERILTCLIMMTLRILYLLNMNQIL
jgi:hypothetical protein